MFVGCFEISSIVIVKHAQRIGIIRAFCLPVPGGLVKIFSAWGDRRNCWVVVCSGGGGVSAQVDTMSTRSAIYIHICIYIYTYIVIYVATDYHYTTLHSAFHGLGPISSDGYTIQY